MKHRITHFLINHSDQFIFVILMLLVVASIIGSFYITAFIFAFIYEVHPAFVLFVMAIVLGLVLYTYLYFANRIYIFRVVKNDGGTMLGFKITVKRIFSSWWNDVADYVEEYEIEGSINKYKNTLLPKKSRTADSFRYFFHVHPHAPEKD